MKLLLGMHDVKRMAGRMGLLAALLPGLVQQKSVAEAGPKRYPVTTEMVVTAMRYRQLPVEGVQVSLSAPITSSTDNPMLDIQSVTQSNPHSAQLRVACRNRSQCLPFYVAATWPESTAGLGLPTLSHPSEAPRPSAKQEKPVSSLTLKAGAPATLLIEDAKVHIRLRVVCLQGGSAGDKVRVSTPDHKVAYKAEIVAPDLLKGSF